jgi:hypothetical protein
MTLTIDGKTCDYYREAFQKEPDVEKRFDILYEAACSGLWKKCTGVLGPAYPDYTDSFTDKEGREKRCIAGLVMDLAGCKIFSGDHGYTGPWPWNDFAPYGRDWGNFPWMEVIGVDFNSGGVWKKDYGERGVSIPLSPWRLNDNSDMELCEISGICREFFKTKEHPVIRIP